ncbi:MAG: hypothetical protein PHZ02_08105 [Desulfocapsaceae bacterium]|nr:hypothetical protein [Desulfocapsaceae bacterium]
MQILRFFKVKFAFIGCLLVPFFMFINIKQGTNIEAKLTLFVIPFFVGGVAGFLIGNMKDKLLKLNADLELLVKQRTAELQQVHVEVKKLRSLLPLCSYCKKNRGDTRLLEQDNVTLNICPDCMKEHYPKEYEAMQLKQVGN